MIQLPLEFPKLYQGLFAQIDEEMFPRCHNYIWGMRVHDEFRSHVVGRRRGAEDRAEISLVNIVTSTGHTPFEHIDGDILNCRRGNLRCLHPRKYKKDFGTEYPGSTSEDADYRDTVENRRLRAEIDGQKPKSPVRIRKEGTLKERRQARRAEKGFLRQIFFP